MKRNLALNDLRFLCYSAKICPDLSGYTGFFIFISQFLDIAKTREIYETVNFWIFRKFFTNKFSVFYVAFWHPIFKRQKRNEEEVGYRSMLQSFLKKTKKPNSGGGGGGWGVGIGWVGAVRIYFSEKLPGNFRFVILRLETPEKTSFHPWKFYKIVKPLGIFKAKFKYRMIAEE